MSKYIISIITIFVAFSITGCGSDNKVEIEDDWPGINNISVINKNTNIQSFSDEKSFDLSSKIALPKMGSDILYVLSSSCIRKSKGNFKKNLTYQKEINSSLNTENKSSIDVVDLLDDEVLIYPDFFESCSFKLNVVNQNGSTDSSELKNLKLIDNEEAFKVKIDFKEATEKFILSKNGGNALRLEDLSNITIESYNQNPIKNPFLLCHSNKITKTPQIDSISERKTIYGDDLKLPVPVLNQPAEHCVIHAKVADGKNKYETITSKRMSFLNSSTLTSTVFTVETSVAKEALPHDYILYDHKKTNSINRDLFTIKISNQSHNTIKYEFDNLMANQNISVIEGLKQKSGELLNKKTKRLDVKYSLVLKDLPVTYEWVSPSIEEITRSITLKPSDSAYLTLRLKGSFICQNPQKLGPASNNQELGFFSYLNSNQKIFNMTETTKNNFLKQTLTSGNILSLHNLKLTNQNNISEDINKSYFGSNDFIYLFRNNTPSHHIPLSLKYNAPADHIMLYNLLQKGTFDINQHPLPNGINLYPFLSKVRKDGQAVCSQAE